MIQVSSSKKTIGLLLMDQSVFAGPGNIYRAEILFKAGVHPNVKGTELGRERFDRVWHHTVTLPRPPPRAPAIEPHVVGHRQHTVGNGCVVRDMACTSCLGALMS